MRRRRFEGRSVFITWVFSHLLLFLVPVLICTVAYFESFRIIEREIARANEAVLSNIRENTDTRLLEMENLAKELSSNRLISAFNPVVKPFSPEDKYEVYQIGSELKRINGIYEFIDNIFIYYQTSDTVITSTGAGDGYALFREIRPSASMDYNEWKTTYSKRYMKEYHHLSRSDGSDRVVYIVSVTITDPTQPSPVIVFDVDARKLLKGMKIVDDNIGYKVIVDSEGNKVTSTGVAPGGISYTSFTEPYGLVKEEVGGEEVAVSYTTSEVNQWKYIAVLPAKVFYERLTYLQNLIMIVLSICLAIGGLIMSFSLKKNYNPLQRLIKTVSRQAGLFFDGKSNEFLYIEKVLQLTLEEKQNLARKLRKQNDVLRNHFLNRLLRGRLDRRVSIEESMSAYNISFINHGFAVIVIRIDNYGKFRSWEGDMAEDANLLQLLYFIITNAMEELCNHQVYTTDIGDFLACIINFPHGGADSMRRELATMAEETQQFMLDKMNVELTVAIGSMQEGLPGIPVAYEQAVHALANPASSGNMKIILFDEIAGGGDQSEGCQYPLHMEHQLINLIRFGDHDSAMNLVNSKLLDRAASLQTVKFTVYNMINTIARAIDDYRPFMIRCDQEHAMERVDEFATVHELKHFMQTLLRDVCEQINEQQNGEQSGLGMRISEYVHAHYQEVNLNISLIGQAFDMTPSYISKKFKQFAGESLLDFINKVRLEAAKETLSSSTAAVQDIASQVGYSDASTFTRIFKKYEGITPTQYREVCNTDSSP